MTLKYRNLVIAVVFLLIAPVWAIAQLDTVWTRTYGTTEFEGLRQVAQTSDRGFIFVGEQLWLNSDPSAIFLVKTDSLGREEWIRTYGGPLWDVPYSVVVCSDGGYLVAGETSSFNPGGVFVLRLNSSGDSLWMAILNSSSYDHLTAAGGIVEPPEGGVLVCGWGWRPPKGNQILLFKLDSQGQLVWEKNYGGPSDDFGWSIQPVREGGYLVAGFSYSFGNGRCDGYLVRINSTGDTLWTRTFGGESFDSFNFARQTSEGGFIAVGSTQSFGMGEQGFIVKMDLNGNQQWNRAIGDTANEGFSGVACSPNNEYVVVGFSKSFGAGEEDGFLMRLDANGATLHQLLIGGPQFDFANFIERTHDGGYILGGLTGSFGAGYGDSWLIRLAADSISQTVFLPPIPKLFNNYPNPFNNETTITFELSGPSDVRITVSDLLGRDILLLTNGSFDAGLHLVTFHPMSFASGVYFYRLEAGKYVQTRKMILLR